MLAFNTKKFRVQREKSVWGTTKTRRRRVWDVHSARLHAEDAVLESVVKATHLAPLTPHSGGSRALGLTGRRLHFPACQGARRPEGSVPAAEHDGGVGAFHHGGFHFGLHLQRCVFPQRQQQRRPRRCWAPHRSPQPTAAARASGLGLRPTPVATPGSSAPLPLGWP